MSLKVETASRTTKAVSLPQPAMKADLRRVKGKKNHPESSGNALLPPISCLPTESRFETGL